MQKTLVTTLLHRRAFPTGIHTNPFYAGTHAQCVDEVYLEDQTCYEHKYTKLFLVTSILLVASQIHAPAQISMH